MHPESPTDPSFPLLLVNVLSTSFKGYYVRALVPAEEGGGALRYFLSTRTSLTVC